ncbi:MAG: amidohydrolase [Xanthobacteraceae bacterium]|nr:amidohydrolase [Xanthobacteraceae bacterium]
MSAHRIDIHHHTLPPAYIEAIGDARIGALLVSGKTPVWTPRHSIEAMDRNGIERAIMSLSAPSPWFDDVGKTRSLTRQCNEYNARARDDHPGRFGLFASLTLPDIEGSLREIAYALDELKADGISLLTNYNGKYPGEPEFAPIFEELHRRHAIVHFHPAEAPDDNPHRLPIPAATLDFPFETTRAVTSLLVHGTLAKSRNVRFIFSHAGGTIPFLAERIARLEMRPEFRANIPDGVMFELKRLYFDTALSANGLIFSALLEFVSHEQILFGSDYPYAPEATTAASVKGLAGLGLPPDILHAIERTNALRLLKVTEAV